ncbi:MAG: IS66 family insertion sequence element accessory protein TnpB [Gammaproteobacteria bacterium]|nr:IS66 family insertion sequence element accessory protein TnpB [Gammaproteobacteria bacterium]
MMRPPNELPAVYVCVAPVDFRLQINGLAARVQESLLLDPLSAQLFVFSNHWRNRVKILYWERNGFVLWQKRLERDRFYWPRSEGATVSLTGQQLNWLLDGFDLSKWRGHARLHYDYVA